MTHSQRDSAMLVWLGRGGAGGRLVRVRWQRRMDYGENDAIDRSRCSIMDGHEPPKLTRAPWADHHRRPTAHVYYDAEGLPGSPLESKRAVEHEDEDHMEPGRLSSHWLQPWSRPHATWWT